MRSEDEAELAAAHAALQTIAVTGTNGKTTTASMLASIAHASGETSALLTTIGHYVGGEACPTVPQDSEFLAWIRRARDEGARSLALEVTSKALANGWAQRWPAHVAVFTNLSRDHLDMHGTPEAYLAAKAQLFMHVASGGTCVLNQGDEHAALLAEVIPECATIRWYGRSEHLVDLGASDVRCTREGLRIELAPGELADALGGVLELPIVGDVHAENALAAALAAHAAGYPASAIAQGLANFRGVPGRFEIVSREPLVVVDYAHSPDGLRGTLTTARSLVGKGGRLIAVFGCGGERDQGKRPLMGAIAHSLADAVIITNDNPRRESPTNIAEHIRSGAKGPGATFSLCLDRAEAIHTAVGSAAPCDVVVIAGKGHETVQELGETQVPFCDADVARAACAKRQEAGNS